MRKMLAGLWLLAAVTVCVAQNEKGKSGGEDRPDLSGTWVLDKSKSYKVSYDLTLNILHVEPEIRITKKYVEAGSASIQQSVYYTDGRVEPGFNQKLDHIFKPVAKWRGKTLVRESVHVTKGTRFEIVTTEEWKLSKDGRTLTNTVVNRQKTGINETIIPRLERKFVFTRSMEEPPPDKSLKPTG